MVDEQNIFMDEEQNIYERKMTRRAIIYLWMEDEQNIFMDDEDNHNIFTDDEP